MVLFVVKQYMHYIGLFAKNTNNTQYKKRTHPKKKHKFNRLWDMCMQKPKNVFTYDKSDSCTYHVCCLLSTEVGHALNVTVTPGPVVMVTEKDNLTVSCLVSQRKRSGSVLILRWFFSPLAAPTLAPPPSSPSPSPPALEPSQFLIVKMGIKKMKMYGNYTRRFPQPKFRLNEEREGEVYRLWILNVTGVDQGFYTCRVQEIRKHRNTWRASSNGTSTTQLTGN